MILTIFELKEDIINRFGNEYGALYFGIEQTIYKHRGDHLTFQVFHYKDNNNSRVYKLTFDEVELCRICKENYNHEFEEETFEGFAFFWQIQNSRFKKDFNLWSTYEGIFGSKQFNSLKSYRIVGQNNFIDVLTTKEPVIELIA